MRRVSGRANEPKGVDHTMPGGGANEAIAFADIVFVYKAT